MVTRQARRSPRTRATTLVEVLIVIAIIGLIAGAVGFAAFQHWVDAQERSTETNARTLRHAVKSWWIGNDPAHCPNLEELIAAGTLDRGSPPRDAWKQAWQIECVDNDVTVTSAGPDRQLGTEDDIRAPPT